MNKEGFITCDVCDSTWVANEIDLIGAYGAKHGVCPVCDSEMIENGDILDADEIRFPEHFGFAELVEETDDEEVQNNERITEIVKEGVKFLKEHETENYWFSADTCFVAVFREESWFRVYVGTEYFEGLCA